MLAVLPPVANCRTVLNSVPALQPGAVLDIWPHGAPGAKFAPNKEIVSIAPNGQFSLSRNVSRPTLTVYLPAIRKTPMTGIIVLPGGAFRFVNLDAEGSEVAQWLVSRGIAAFVLKYRTVTTPVDAAQMWNEIIPALSDPRPLFTAVDADSAPALADGARALRVVRENAGKWNLAPARIGMLGFSAGGMVAALLALGPPGPERPDFVALVYGAPFGKMPTVPSHGPPLFMAYARDDLLAGNYVAEFQRALRFAGQRPQLRIYADGGHGFGITRHGKASDRWSEDFYDWLIMRHLVPQTRN